jgi:SpoVK/Ycf46/Vps4 family AAA+-type ATPase
LPSATLGLLEDLKRHVRRDPDARQDWGVRRELRPGVVCLFHGAPGTGKTLAAGLLGTHWGRDVYRIGLSELASKYVGETEKNLARVFDLAERNGWILFFDEAETLFGRRTGVSDAHDRFANLEVNNLLQRAERSDAVVIVSSNLESIFDDAFARRCRSVVHFPMPGPAERLRLWRQAFPGDAHLDASIDLPAIAEKHEVSGGTIVDAARRALLAALARGDETVRAADLEEGLRRSGA